MEVGQHEAPLRVAECVEGLARRFGPVEVSFDDSTDQFAVRVPRYIWKHAGAALPVIAHGPDLFSAAAALRDACDDDPPVALPSGVTQWVIRPPRT